MSEKPVNLEMEPNKLIKKARQIISRYGKEGRHHIGCALLTKSGRIYQSVHIEANVGRIAVCAEAIAIGMAASNGDTDLEMLVAVDLEGGIVSPCGMCRELISDYAQDCKVILPDGNIVGIMELLPHKYQR